MRIENEHINYRNCPGCYSFRYNVNNRRYSLSGRKHLWGGDPEKTSRWSPVPGFVLMSQGYSAILSGLSIFACFGRWFLGAVDTRYGTRTAVLITAILMLTAGLLGMVDNP